jgi:two-component system, LytTR family, response regulator
MNLKIVIVDDEPKNLRILRELVANYCSGAEIIGEANDLNNAKVLLKSSKPDLLLLDIEMPNGNGFDLLDQIMPVDFEVVFVTAFDRYAVTAFRYAALDYLLKPISIDDLQKAIERTRSRIITKQKNPDRSLLVQFQSVENEKGKKKIAVPLLPNGYEFVEVDEIIYFESKNRYTHIFTSTNKRFLSSLSLKKYEEMLAFDHFIRIHHSCLINSRKIKKYIPGRGGRVELENGTLFEVAVRRKDELLLKLGL